MFFRKALAADGNRCLEIYNKICDWEDVNGRQTFWDKIFYPNMDTVQKALDADEVLVLHTFAVDPDLQGKGYGRTFMSFYEDGIAVYTKDRKEDATESKIYEYIGFS